MKENLLLSEENSWLSSDLRWTWPPDLLSASISKPSWHLLTSEAYLSQSAGTDVENLTTQEGNETQVALTLKNAICIMRYNQPKCQYLIDGWCLLETHNLLCSPKHNCRIFTDFVMELDNLEVKYWHLFQISNYDFVLNEIGIFVKVRFHSVSSAYHQPSSHHNVGEQSMWGKVDSRNVLENGDSLHCFWLHQFRLWKIFGALYSTKS